MRSKETTGPEDWKLGLAKETHWRTGYSAKALAHSWEEADGFPPEVKEVLEESGFEQLKALDFLRGDVEFVVPIPGGRRGSHNDILVTAKSPICRTAMAVEGKVSEDFAETVGEWLGRSSQSRSGKPERLRFLKRKLGIEDRDVSLIRYQLLHRTASALIAAEDVGASNAVMLVHSFSQTDEHLADYQAFLGLFGVEGEANSVSYAGSRQGIHLYLAWVRGEDRFLKL